MHGPRLRATPRRVALFALVAIAATDQLDDLSSLVQAQGRMLEQMQQQIQSLELAVLQSRAQGADELISAPGRSGRRLDGDPPATQRKTWHHSILHSFDDPSSCGLNAELNSDQTGPLDITRTSDGNVSMGYGGAVSATQPAAFELNHPANCRTATLTSNHPLDVSGDLTVIGSLHLRSPPVIDDANLRVATGAFGLKYGTYTLNYVNTAWAAANGNKLQVTAFGSAALGDGVKFFYAEPLSPWCLTLGCAFSIRLSTRAESGFASTPTTLGTNMFVHSVGAACTTTDGTKLQLWEQASPGRSNCLFRFADAGSGLVSLQAAALDSEIEVMCAVTNGICNADGDLIHFWRGIKVGWTLIK